MYIPDDMIQTQNPDTCNARVVCARVPSRTHLHLEDREVGPDADDVAEAPSAHELAHALHQRVVPAVFNQCVCECAVVLCACVRACE